MNVTENEEATMTHYASCEYVFYIVVKVMVYSLVHDMQQQDYDEQQHGFLITVRFSERPDKKI